MYICYDCSLSSGFYKSFLENRTHPSPPSVPFPTKNKETCTSICVYVQCLSHNWPSLFYEWPWISASTFAKLEHGSHQALHVAVLPAADREALCQCTVISPSNYLDSHCLPSYLRCPGFHLPHTLSDTWKLSPHPIQQAPYRSSHLSSTQLNYTFFHTWLPGLWFLN